MLDSRENPGLCRGASFREKIGPGGDCMGTLYSYNDS
jgi:hypothetical protein